MKRPARARGSSFVARRGSWRRRIVLLLTLVMVAGGIYTAVAFLQRSDALITERCTAVGQRWRRPRRRPGGQRRPHHRRRRPARTPRQGRQHRPGHVHAGIQTAQYQPRGPGGPGFPGPVPAAAFPGLGHSRASDGPLPRHQRVLRCPREGPRLPVAGDHGGRATSPALGLPCRLCPTRGDGSCVRFRAEWPVGCRTGLHPARRGRPPAIRRPCRGR